MEKNCVSMENGKKNGKVFNRDFIMVVVGQIISLFGNSILRFALPLYLLNQTGSSSLFGVVVACSFVPMIVLGPVGGIFADRVNKKNIMVILDFATAVLTFAFAMMLGNFDVVWLILVTMMILYGIQGAYQPAVQSSIPVLVPQENIMQANAIINLVNSFSGLIGPVVGGALFAFFGVYPILYVSIVCFMASAVMEIFIRIPFEKKKSCGNIFAIGFSDIRESLGYMVHEKPIILKLCFIVAVVNFFLTALVIIGLPVLITQILGFEPETANRLYGYAEGVIAAGSLVGGMSAGILSKRLKVKNGYKTLLFCALTLLPIGLAVFLNISNTSAYFLIMISCFVMMILATLFSVQIISYLQIIAPNDMIGKIISCASCIGMCATPLGQVIYGWLFEVFSGNVYVVIFVAMAITCLISVGARGIFLELEEIMSGENL